MFRKSLRIVVVAALVGVATPPASASAAGSTVKQIAAGGQDTAMLDSGRVRVSSSSGVAAATP